MRPIKCTASPRIAKQAFIGSDFDFTSRSPQVGYMDHLTTLDASGNVIRSYTKRMLAFDNHDYDLVSDQVMKARQGLSIVRELECSSGFVYRS